MRKTVIHQCGLALAAVTLCVGMALAQSPQRYTGNIMDSACAVNGNHDAGYKMTGTHTPRACTLACVKAGSTFVLYNADNKTTYKLDNQTMPRRFAGENVTVTGTLDPATETIHVDRIVKAKPASK